MKQFYAVEPKHKIGKSRRVNEQVEYDIISLIKLEAECIIDCDDSLGEDLTDQEYEILVNDKALKIMDELTTTGIYRNEFGIPIFLYC